MSHRRIKNWIQDYVDHTLSSQKCVQVEQHVASCLKCREEVKLARIARGITIASRVDDECLPGSRFVPSVMAAIEQQKENYLFWSPVRLLALRAIPVMALLAFVLSAVAYTQLVPALTALSREPSSLEAYLDLVPAWDQERLMLSATALGDSEKPLKDEPSDTPGLGRQ